MSLINRLFVPLSFAGFAILFVIHVWSLDFRSTAFPYLAIFFILLLSGAEVYRQVTRPRPSDVAVATAPRDGGPAATDGARLRAYLIDRFLGPALTVLALVAYVYAMPLLGFGMSTYLFLVVSSIVIFKSVKNIPIILVVMVIITLISDYFFRSILQVHLP